MKNNYVRYNYLLRNIVLATIFINIFFRYKEYPKSLVIYLGLFICILVNDYIRHNLLLANMNKWFKISLIFSIISGAVLVYFLRGYTDVYLFIIIYEIVMFLEGYFLKLILAIQVSCVCYIFFFSNGRISDMLSKSFWVENSMDFLMIVLLIAFLIIFFLYTKVQIREKIRFRTLNMELNESYKTLQEYSQRIEKLTISEERNRVAQEIHDSLGHSLTGLIMHLDYLDKVVENDIGKTRDIIVKSQDIARHCMNDLRKAVFALKEDYISNGLRASLDELKINLTVNNEMDIDYEIELNLEKLSPNLKILFIEQLKKL